MKSSLGLSQVVLLGRTLEEYQRALGLDLSEWRGKRILDVAAGVSSFTAEACGLGFDVTALDPIYQLSSAEIRPRCEHDLELVAGSIGGVSAYRWAFYEAPERMRQFRQRAYREFLTDFEKNSARYVAGQLPTLPFADASFDLTLVSYLLFVYEDHLDHAFHCRALEELLRVTRGEVRIYPLVNFSAGRSRWLDALKREPRFQDCTFAEVPTDFEFLRGSNSFLRVTRCG